MSKVTVAGVAGIFLLLGNVHAHEELVEIRLIDNVDEPRGYCLDIAGGRGRNAPLNRGLQAHTCYDYTGGLLEDQSFDAAQIAQGQFRIPYFDVCMSVLPVDIGSSVTLAPCDNTEAQTFSLQPNGQLTPKARMDLCVTVSRSDKREGRGGTPVHVMRPLSLQSCSDEQFAYQAWTVFSL